MPPKKKTTVTNEVVVPEKVVGKVKVDSALWQIRELCRKHHLQTLGKESLANQIYQDLLFIYHIPRLFREGILNIDIQRIGDGKIQEVSYSSLLSLKEPELINACFKRLWKELQRCVLEELFKGREFTMFVIEKKNPERYMNLLLDLFKYFASIELEEYDSNAGYTYFKKDLNKAVAKTFGQFYTPSSVTASVVNLVNPKVGEKVLDPSCGSCSFLAEAANYMVKKEGVDMKTAFENLYGTEVETNIYTEGIMNMFINFGIIPDMKKCIREVDALIDMANSDEEFDAILANPPFGADASTFHEFYFKTIMEAKGKRMIKKTIVNPEVKCLIPFTKTKESAVIFFQFIIQKLKKDGKAGVVMSSTILNDGHKEMMEWFLKCCSLEKVVINPAGSFKEQGTGIETFSFIFTKGMPTTTVEIVMLGAENVAMRTLTIDQIKEAGWKLQLKEEEKKVVYTGVYELKKLGDICDCPKTIKRFNSGDRDPTGTVPFFNGKWSCPDGTHIDHSFDLDSPYLVMIKDGGGDHSSHTVGMGKFFKVRGKCAITSHNMVLAPKPDNGIEYDFLYHYLTMNSKSIRDMATYSINLGSISKENIVNYEIPLPPLLIQQEIVTNLDRIFADPQDMKDCLAFTDKAMDLMLKDPTGKQLEDVMGGLRLKRSHQINATSVKAQMAAVVRSVGARGFERKKLGDVCDLLSGKTNNERGVGDIPFYDSNGQIGVVEKHLFHGEFVITARVLSVGSVNYVSGKFWAGDNTINIRIKEGVNMSTRFFYYWLVCNTHLLKELSSGIKPYIRKSDVAEILMPVPPLPIQHEVLVILNEMEAELATLEQMAAKAEQRAKYILDGYLTPAAVATE